MGRAAALPLVVAAVSCEGSVVDTPTTITLVSPTATLVDGGPRLAGSFILRAQLPSDASGPTEVWLHRLTASVASPTIPQALVEIGAVTTDRDFPLVLQPNSTEQATVQFELDLPLSAPSGMCAGLAVPTAVYAAEVYDARAAEEPRFHGVPGMIQASSVPVPLSGIGAGDSQQAFPLVWEAHYPWVGTQSVSAVSMSAAGEVVIAATSDSGFATEGVAAVPLTAGSFLLAIDAAHQAGWSKPLGGASVTVGRVAHDPAGNVLVAGTLGSGTLTVAEPPLTSETGLPMPFVTKLSAAGEHLYSAALRKTVIDRLQGSTFVVRDRAIAVDAAGHVHFAGFIDGEADLAGHLTDSLAVGFFLLELDQSGAVADFDIFPNALSIAPPGNIDLLAAAPDTGLVLAGTAYSALQLGGELLEGTSSSDLVVARFDASGGHVYSRRFRGAAAVDSALPTAVAVGAEGNAFVLGDLYGSFAFDDVHVEASTTSTAFVLALDPLGKVLWATPLGGSGMTRDLAVVGDRVLATRGIVPPDQTVQIVLDELTLGGRPSRSAVIGCGGAAIVASRPGSNQLALALGGAVADLGGGPRTAVASTMDLFAGVLTVR